MLITEIYVGELLFRVPAAEVGTVRETIDTINIYSHGPMSTSSLELERDGRICPHVVTVPHGTSMFSLFT